MRKTVEDTLNDLLEEETGDLVGAERYERTAGREVYRAGDYELSLTTSSGEAIQLISKLKGMWFAMAIIERYRRRKTSVEEAMIGTCLAGVSTRRIDDGSEIMWGWSVSAAASAKTPTHTRFPREHWRRIRANNAIERLNREIRRRTCTVGTLPDGKSALTLVTARLKHAAESSVGPVATWTSPCWRGSRTGGQA